MMARSLLVLISDDQEITWQARRWGQSSGVGIVVFTPEEWNRGLGDSAFRNKLQVNIPHLSVGLGNEAGETQGGKVLPFPVMGPAEIKMPEPGKKVATINELECIAIEKAIRAYNGNLTEAAKALGIGRATLYRKVKLYKINIGIFRHRKTAA